MERLVCRGADLTAIDQDGNTPLHLLLAGHGMEQLCADTPLLNRVRVPHTFQEVLLLCLACKWYYYCNNVRSSLALGEPQPKPGY